MQDGVTMAALAGLARGMSDFWPADVPINGLTSALLDQAEKHVRGDMGSAASARAPAALTSVFSRLTLSGSQPSVKPRLLPIAPLRLDKTVLFPREAPGGDPALLRRDFQQVVRAAKGVSTRVLLETALDAAMRFAWCVPAGGYPDPCTVSRFDHARSVAAVAACLAQPLELAQPSFILVGADLSGIQSFIYTLASEGAAKSLRARSFYVQLLTEAIARYVLTRLGLPITSALYIGGGGFQLIAPGSAATLLPDIETDVQRRLLAAHRAALCVTLRGYGFTAADFARFGEVRDALGRVVNTAKRKPFAAVAADDLVAYLGQPFGHGGDQTDYCRVTGEELPPSPNSAEVKSDLVVDLERLGINLREASHLVMAEAPPTSPERVRSWRAALRMFGLSVDIITRYHPTAEYAGNGTVRLARLSPEPLLQDAELIARLGGREVATSYYPFARLVPWNGDENRPMMFDELADSSAGLKRWAVLRMDVDNLGALFRSGFGNNPSMAQTAGLSFALRLFFEGWLPILAGQKKALANKLYIQYAGGDDVFVVGAWDAIADYALDIQASFREYVCENPEITLSAGITLADGGFPLYQAARMAGDAEDAAKHYASHGKRKDAVSFLTQVVSWAEYAVMHDQAGRLAVWCRDGIASRSLLQTLQQLHIQASDEPRSDERARPGAGKRRYTRATWLAAYQLTRVADAIKKSPEAVQEVRELQQKLIAPDAQFNLIATAARWAQFLIRSGSKE